MKTIILDTASKYLYFSFLEDDKVIYEVFREGKNNHSDNLLNYVEAALDECNLKLGDFSKVVVGIGPGSYTGLRVSMTVAKMLAWSLNLELYITSSLSLLASGYFNVDGNFAITIKAKKNHIYGKFIEVKNGKVSTLMDDLFSEESVFFESIKDYNYKLINEENYKIDTRKLILEKVDNLHALTPNYIQKGI